MKPSDARRALSRFIDPFRNARLREEQRNEPGHTLSRRAVRYHLAWMAKKALEHLDDGRTEKAHRWLGFIQGASWMLGEYSINSLRDMNKGRDSFWKSLNDQ